MKKLALLGFLSLAMVAQAEDAPTLYNDMTAVNHGFVRCVQDGQMTRIKSEGCYVMVEDRTFPESNIYKLFEWNEYVTRVTGRKNHVVTGIARTSSIRGSAVVDIYYIYPAGE